MANMKRERTITPLRVLAGPEIETLADYFGQGALGVFYNNPTTDLPSFHPLKNAYNDIIAQPLDQSSQLCMSTDSNRSEEGANFPKRTSIEFRAGPEQHNTQELLHLTKAYSDWLTRQKEFLRLTAFQNYANPNRREHSANHYLNLSDFIAYYNGLKQTPTKLQLSSPHIVFDPKNAGPDFEFIFPKEARWVLQLKYDDLAPQTATVFTTQYNLSLPIGCIFDPRTKAAFPLIKEFPLLEKEKEVAADFNESRPHLRLRQYEQQVFSAAVKLADQLFSRTKLPLSALGARDFLRGMAYEIALISTSQAYLAELFQDDAIWIAQQQLKVAVALGGKDKMPSANGLHDIATSLANTLRKSIFPYFMKATLAEFFKYLHPYEQQLLRAIPQKEIKKFCQQAIKLANGGVGNTKDHPGHLMFKHDSFMEFFDDFYEQTFNNAPVAAKEAPADPIGCLTDRFIPSTNLGSALAPVAALVVELRAPAQGKQQYPDIQNMCRTFALTHQALLKAFHPIKQESHAALDQLQQEERQTSLANLTKARLARPRITPLPSAAAAIDTTPAKSTRSKRKAEPEELKTPLVKQSLFSRKATKSPQKVNSALRVKPQGLFSEPKPVEEKPLDGMVLRKRAKR